MYIYLLRIFRMVNSESFATYKRRKLVFTNYVSILIVLLRDTKRLLIIINNHLRCILNNRKNAVLPLLQSFTL